MSLGLSNEVTPSTSKVQIPLIIRIHIHEIVILQCVVGGGRLELPVKLSTTVSKFSSLLNSENASLLRDLYEFMKNNGLSERHMNNTLKTNLAFAEFLGDIPLFDIDERNQVISFLDSKIKSIEEDPDKKWITTWNDYLSDIKYFFRWLYNWKMRNNDPNRDLQTPHDWETPSFVRIKRKKTKRPGP